MTALKISEKVKFKRERKDTVTVQSKTIDLDVYNIDAANNILKDLTTKLITLDSGQ